MINRFPIFGFFSAFTLGALFIRPIDLLVFNGFSKHSQVAEFDSSYFIFTSLIIFIFYLSSGASYLVMRGNRRRIIKKTRYSYETHSVGKCLLVFLIVFMLAFNMFYLPKLTTYVIAARVDGQGVFGSIAIYKLFTNTLIILFSFLIFFTKKSKLVVIGWLLALLMCLFVGDRSLMVMPIVLLVLSYHYTGAISGGRLSFFLLVGVASMTTLGIARNLILYEIVVLPSASNVLSHGLNLIAYDQFLLYVQATEVKAIRAGADFVNGFAAFVPRSVWPDKPALITPGAWLGFFIYGRSDLGLPYTTAGLWFSNFGLLGVVVGGMLTGCLLGFIQNQIDLGRDVMFWVAIYFMAALTGISSLTLSKAFFNVVAPWFVFRAVVKKRSLAVN